MSKNIPMGQTSSSSSSFFITDYGAVGDGATLNTAAIQGAVNACSTNGGGTVVVPPGVFVSGTVELRSHVTLYLENGAVLKGSERLSDYRGNGFIHAEYGDVISFLYAIDHSQIRITGEGVIDLSGHAFMDQDRLLNCPVPAAELDEAQIQDSVCVWHARPTHLLFFKGCRALAIDQVTIKNAPCWTISLMTCRDIKIHHVTIDNNLRFSNTDGIHLCACKDAVITDNNISAGDDCVAITGITRWDEISERILVSSCILRSRSAAVRLGHLASKVQNILISNIVVHDSNRGIAIFSGDGGWVKNVRISDVQMETRIAAGGWWGKGEPLVISAGDSDGQIANIAVSGVTAAAENSIVVVGRDKNVRGISLSDWRLVLKPGRNRAQFGGQIDIQPAQMRPALEGRIPWIFAEDVSDLQVRDFQYGQAGPAGPPWNADAHFDHVDGLRLDNVRNVPANFE